MKAAIVGATGYGGLELIRLISQHPQLTLNSLHSLRGDNELLSTIYPLVQQTPYDLAVEPFEPVKISKEADVVFFATPAGIAKDLIPQLDLKKIQVIDLSGDLRLEKREDYEKWYQNEAASQELINQAVYGLSEWHHDKLQGAMLISNPGCYATAILLGLTPLYEKLDIPSVIIDAKSGVSGAGKALSEATHFMQTHDNLQPYKMNAHQHLPEIEQQLGWVNEAVDPLTMTTQLLPIARGLMAVMYVTTTLSTSAIKKIYQDRYATDPFIRLSGEKIPTIQQVIGSNYCDIGWHKDERTGRLTVVTVIDNLLKGAAGQAVQNLNISQGWDETLGLPIVPMFT